MRFRNIGLKAFCLIAALGLAACTTQEEQATDTNNITKLPFMKRKATWGGVSSWCIKGCNLGRNQEQATGNPGRKGG